jgi:hypothetical protein
MTAEGFMATYLRRRPEPPADPRTGGVTGTGRGETDTGFRGVT